MTPRVDESKGEKEKRKEEEEEGEEEEEEGKEEEEEEEEGIFLQGFVVEHHKFVDTPPPTIPEK